jgi:hypothetical protein
VVSGKVVAILNIIYLVKGLEQQGHILFNSYLQSDIRIGMVTDNQKNYLPWAKITKSLRPRDPGANKYRLKYDAIHGRGTLVKVRYRKCPDGTTKKTFELCFE